MNTMQKLLDTYPADDLNVGIGEGETGTAEEYRGKRTPAAIRRRLTAERCSGDRWARAVVSAGGYDLETGEPRIWVAG